MERASGKMKLFDRYAGIPMVWMQGMLRRRRPLPSPIRSIGLFKEACIGDTILLAGLIADLRKAYPEAKVVLFVGPTNKGIAALLDADERVELPVTSPFRCARLMRRHPVDVLLDFGQWPRINAVYSWLSSAAYTVGFSTAGQHRHYGYDAVVEHRNDRHELANFQAILAPLGVESKGVPAISVDGEAPVDGKYVVCHPWPGGTLSEVREWPQERWVELMRRFRSQGKRVLVTGGTADRERSEALARLCADDGVEVRAGKDGLVAVANLLRRATCVVSVNTGIMHLAAAVGAPTLGLNGPTAEHRWGPVGAKVDSVSVPLPHGGYLNLGFEYEGRPRDCMERIGVDEVWQKVAQLAGAEG